MPLVKAMAPASLSKPISVISSPSSPLVIAAIGCTLTCAVSRARRMMKSTSATSSMTGSVLGMPMKVVTPPAAAARLAVASVSRCSCPGSPENTIMSMSPGVEDVSPAIDGLGVAKLAVCDTAVRNRRSCFRRSARRLSRRGPWRDRSAARRGARRGAFGRAGRGRARPWASLVRQMTGERLKHRHAHRHAHLDLLADHTSRVVGDIGVDLHAAIHRAGMHDQRIGLGAGELVVVKPEEVEILALARHERSRSCARAGACSIMTMSAPSSPARIEL